MLAHVNLAILVVWLVAELVPVLADRLAAWEVRQADEDEN
jgi:hypothetical protein